jgi:crotonobetaine/carnitine-CoA ligase
MVVLALQPGRAPRAGALLHFLAPRMAYYMLPRYLRIVDELPKTPTAKVEKHRLRADCVTADTWDREAHGPDGQERPPRHARARND